MCSCSSDNSIYSAPTTIHPLIDEYPSWSSDGTRICYNHNGLTEINNDSYISDPDSFGIWMINYDGTNPHMLLSGARNAEWSSNDEWITYNLGSQIYKARILSDFIDTTSIEQLTFNGHNYFPTWSNNDLWIAYESDLPTGHMYSIWRMKSDGSSKSFLHDNARGCDWSPSVDRISIHKYLNTGAIEIFTIDTMGNDPLQITYNKLLKRFAKYSPIGNKIAYIISMENNYNVIQIINIDGSDQFNLSSDAGFSGLAWSPDGMNIVFSNKNTGNLKTHGTLWIINIQDYSLRQLTPGIY